MATTVAVGVVSALVLTGCSRADAGGREEATGSALPAGSSAADFQEALSDMADTTLVFQSTVSSADSPDAVSTLEFIERVDEYSSGKITLDVTWANGIVPNVVEVDKALADGRIDIGYAWPQYNASEYPANNLLVNLTLLRDPQIVPGYYSIMASLQQEGLQTPEIMEEYTKQGITPLTVMGADGPSIIACTEPVLTLADLAGKQIRAGGVAQSRQIEELGAVPVSMPYTEVYEALQRGILDCSMSAHAIAVIAGHTEVAPFIMHTTAASFVSTPSNLYAGPVFTTLPVVAQQLILESVDIMRGASIESGLSRIATTFADSVADNGGALLAFDPEVDARLAEINEGIVQDAIDSDLLDGASLVQRIEAANVEWLEIGTELGYTEDGPVEEFPEWYIGTDSEPWASMVSEMITQKRFS
ncbi:TRAP transporter substrate-binding protein DctP [Salinibacterium sp. SWN139]|uniref:TRAP transporter substrate-binding protein DctP n=1 Tax=Salinibacterium sp. SWN139 TaxID=2792055 RepID=UPI0018CCB5CC|nr:TRAP transporter substrate-binding protein DctP [Salinibacterium sp. SWN139]MBH0053036.1 TRAP transporter substrate-binding protein DctP [Salinibacterium sp. SWN139]